MNISQLPNRSWKRKNKSFHQNAKIYSFGITLRHSRASSIDGCHWVRGDHVTAEMRNCVLVWVADWLKLVTIISSLAYCICCFPSTPSWWNLTRGNSYFDTCQWWTLIGETDQETAKSILLAILVTWKAMTKLLVVKWSAHWTCNPGVAGSIIPMRLLFKRLSDLFFKSPPPSCLSTHPYKWVGWNVGALTSSENVSRVE